MDRVFFIIGAILGGSGVALGAFGAHGLRHRVAPEALAIFETAVRYQLIHALVLLASAWAVSQWNNGPLRVAGWLLAAGTLIFSGTLYVLVLTGQRWLGAITPLGGLGMIAGWLLLVVGAWRR
jgi:uncharacterized membrane protein YgdD (TMEM256/DUF423 family)